MSQCRNWLSISTAVQTQNERDVCPDLTFLTFFQYTKLQVDNSDHLERSPELQTLK